MDVIDAKTRLVGVFEFLKELNELRNPIPHQLSEYPTVLRVDDWPQHPFVEVRRGDPPEAEEKGEDEQPEPLIRIRRVDLTACPAPPAMLDGWLKPGWHSAEAKVEVLDTRNSKDQQGRTATVSFRDDPTRIDALTEWSKRRQSWAEAERPALAARRLFEEVHSLWAAIQREGERTELILGDGLLEVKSEAIRHPVLLQRLNLQFEGATPEFRLFAGVEKVELDRRLLREVPQVDPSAIAQLDKDLDSIPVEPLGGDSTTEFLRRLVHGLFATTGEFVSDSSGSSSAPVTLRRSPTIFARSRSAGLATTLDHIVEDLQQREDAPPTGLARIVGVAPERAVAVGEHREGSKFAAPIQSDVDILFSKPANAEQHEIAERLLKAKAVLVQGPPGTGKTHTIANLLGLLLAQGKTVLVTAHTTKALRVLREQVEEVLRPLCLSVLDSDAESQNQLKQAAAEIAQRLSSSNVSNLRRDAAQLRAQRSQLRQTEGALRRRLRDARYSEIEEVVVGGEGLSPIEVAKRVAANTPREGWIPGPLEAGTLCPLSDAEVRQLYRSNTTLTVADEAQLAVPQPELAQLISATDFRQLASINADAGLHVDHHRIEFWRDGGNEDVTSAQLGELHRQLRAATSLMDNGEYWLQEVLFAGWSGGDSAGTWRDLLQAVDVLVTEAAAAERLIAEHGPQLPDNRPVEEIAEDFGEIVSYLEGGGSFGFKTRIRKRAWHKLLADTGIDPGKPKVHDQIRACHAKARLEVRRAELKGRWARVVERRNGPPFENFGERPELSAQSLGGEIHKRLEWRGTVWEPLIEKFHRAGFRWEDWLAGHPPIPGAHGELARIQEAATNGLVLVVAAQAAWLRQTELSAALSQQRTYLAGFLQSEAAEVLRESLASWDATAYEEACREIARLDGLREIYHARAALLHQLQPYAAAWADAISERQGAHALAEPPGDPIAAWRWRQWHQVLEGRAAVSISNLQEQLDVTEGMLRLSAAEIIEKETWAAQIGRTDLQSQQALTGYVLTVRRIGRGTGKRAPELRRQARQLLASARRAVPVWIMPLARVYESFDPRETRFDVVIIDEASQSDVTALAALYLGREHVVVGDHEQVTPDAVGQRIDQVDRLIQTNLQEIPNSHLYDGQTSIYDLAQTAFGGVVALREHFRCVPEIIQFSNQLSYDGVIRPLREPSTNPLSPSLVAHRVPGFCSGKRDTNEVEAEEIASLIVACIEDDTYYRNDYGQTTTFGVISLLGMEQALLIEEMLRKRLSPAVYAERRLLCGNAAQFQGDERDVIFLSMVDGPPETGQLARREDGARGIYKKRYNVAVSRARNQLWVVHSVDPVNHLQARDLRRRLIEHARDPQAALNELDNEGRETDSIFEREVLRRLSAAGYKVHAQWRVGAYRIDLVVEAKTQRLAVECDGDRYHTPEQLQGDLEREAILRRLGWKFVRIRGSVFFRDPDAAMAPVFRKLDQLGIEP